MKYYTYYHRRPDTGQVFYVGKGCRKRAYNTNRRGSAWDAIYKAVGRLVEIVAYWETEEQAYENEVKLISMLRASGVNLVNKTSGGDGFAGVSMAGRSFSDDHKKKISLSKIGVSRPDNSERNKALPSRKGIPLNLTDSEIQRRKEQGKISGLAGARKRWEGMTPAQLEAVKAKASENQKRVWQERRAANV